MVFTCAGVLPSQYLHFSSAWEKLVHGQVSVHVCYNCTLTKHCDVTVYKKGGYLAVVNACAMLRVYMHQLQLNMKKGPLPLLHRIENQKTLSLTLIFIEATNMHVHIPAYS